MDVMKEWPADQWPGHSGNWNRWPNDLGTLNLLTPRNHPAGRGGGSEREDLSSLTAARS